MKRVIEPLPFAHSTPMAAPAPAWPLAPMLAGARARGVADAFEWLGLAAILIDQHGEVLHMNLGAVELMEEELHREGGRLRARDQLADMRLRIAIAAALRDGETTDFVASDALGRGGLNIRVSPIGGHDEEDAFQLLRVVVMLNREYPPRDRRN